MSLVGRLKRFEPAAWEEVFDEHHLMVFRASLAQTGDRTAAEDVTSQVFIEAFQGIGRYRDRGKPLSAWLLTIARHRCIDWRRKRLREAASSLGPEAEQIPSVAGPDATALEVLHKLAPHEQQVLSLRFIEGYSIDETAQVLGRTVGAVKQLQRRALVKARQALEPGGLGDAR